DVIAFFKEDGFTARTPPLAQVRAMLSAAPKEDLNRFEACIPLFAYTEKKDKLVVLGQVSKVDLNRPFFLRRLNRLIRVAGALEIRSASKKIQEILDFSRGERIYFLEETSVVTLCQLLTRSIIEQSREYFKEPGKNVRSLNGYIRGARYIPAKIMIGALTQILLVPTLNPQSRALVIDTLENMDLSTSKKVIAPVLHILDVKDVDEALKLRAGDILCRNGDSSLGTQALDLTNHPTAAGKKVAARLLRALTARGEGPSTDIATNRLYLLIEHADKGVRVEALLALLALGDDYAAQVLHDFVQARDETVVADVIAGLAKPMTREVFTLVLDMLRMDSVRVQTALRGLLSDPDIQKGGFSEELRRQLVSVLSLVPGDRGRGEAAKAVLEAVSTTEESTFDQAKLQYKFRRENTQTLTVFFIDIAGYTEKSTAIDPSALMKLIRAFEEIVTTTITGSRGTVVKKMGDGILAVFKHPLNAVVAALAVQQKIHDYSAMRVEQEKFQARIGLNTGPVIRRDNDIFGEHVNIASRMQNKASSGEVILTEATYSEIRDYVRCTSLGKIEVKGIKDPVMAYTAKEVTVDLSRTAEEGEATMDDKKHHDASLQRLKEAMFVPRFQIPADKGERSALAGELKEVFSELSRLVEDFASDYHQDYDYKKFLQEKWNALVARL
ncbi:MAG TPA: adenylate/guanylate cyclase domain-containing protein, partial [Spirochaetia bacterium]|nr:adenylate/guanylate cyclase domain-containing protein [Spirochaetia bacterium]